MTAPNQIQPSDTETPAAQHTATSEQSPQVVYEERDHRHFKRIRIPGHARIEDREETHAINDLSVGGCNISLPSEGCSEGDELELTLVLPFHAFDLKLKAQGRVLRINSRYQHAAIQFTDNNPHRSEVIRRVTTALITGEFGEVDGLIDLYKEMKDEESYQIPGAAPKRPLAQTLRYLTLLGIGGLLLVVMLFSLHSLLFRVDASYASVVSPVVRLSAPPDTVVSELRVTAGSRVKAGETLFVVRDLNLEEKKALIQAQIGTQQTELTQLNDELTEANARLASYQSYLASTQQNLTREIASLERNHATQQSVYEKNLKGSHTGAVRGNDLAKLALELENIEVQLLQRKQALLGVESDMELAKLGLKSSRIDVDGRFPSEIKKEIAFGLARLGELQQQLLQADQQLASLVVSSPCDCKVSSVRISAGETITSRSAVLELRAADRDKLVIEALIPQERIAMVGLGNSADVLLSDRKDLLTGQVIKVERVKSEATLKGVPQNLFDNESGAVVYIELPVRGDLDPGVPAQVSIQASLAAATMNLFGNLPF
ncbi:PilZ domain-containing protein [Halioxenophilus sp. WMMB6]|uniref:PilZ domain-containing protein n=1 Tax=Halioxenophilus sp. WMMB6 TaxID=3073815 RepID=UPI00295F57EB|nr:HlyD family efflux transporter periplasmic adaptor subunit [Halioxenophilus sp. WMMB6]